MPNDLATHKPLVLTKCSTPNWRKLIGKRKIAPNISPNKTWEGFIGGIATAVALGTSLWWITAFSPLQALLLSLAATLMGFAGGLTMSAIKRDSGVKDFGTTIEGHGGILDRMDSICFSAPLFLSSHAMDLCL